MAGLKAGSTFVVQAIPRTINKQACARGKMSLVRYFLAGQVHVLLCPERSCLSDHD
jgi:hypothetical protein